MPTGVYYRSPELKKKVKECLAIGRSPENQKKAAETLRKLAQTDEWRKKVSEGTKKAMHRPEVRQKHLAGLARALKKHGVNFKGGLGHPLTKTVKEFASILEPLGFEMEYVVSTHTIRKLMTDIKMKGSYSIDFAHPKARVAIELDGPSHRNMRKKALDKKKTMVLEKLGWKVLRIVHN